MSPTEAAMNRMNRIITRMRPRTPTEPHRTASPLELFFDLVFVVAVSSASSVLLKFEEEGHLGVAVMGFSMAFIAVWWAWMNFTWFANSYSTDDWLYRVLTLIQMAGALVFAAGVPGVADPEHPNFTLSVTGYVIMRIAMICQWLRAARSDPAGRKTALAYAVGIAVVQVYWVWYATAAELHLGIPLFWLGMLLELGVPVVAERIKTTPLHQEHIADRYGAFTLIVLGESVLAATTVVIESSHKLEQDPHMLPGLLSVCISGFVTISCMWWTYFALPQDELVTGFGKRMTWAYGHFFILASAAAVSAGLEIAIATLDGAHGESHLSLVAANSTFSVPVAVYVFFVWLLTIRPQSDRATNIVVPILALLIGLSAFLPFSLIAVSVLMVVVVMFLSIHSAPRCSPLHHA